MLPEERNRLGSVFLISENQAHSRETRIFEEDHHFNQKTIWDPFVHLQIDGSVTVFPFCSKGELEFQGFKTEYFFVQDNVLLPVNTDPEHVFKFRGPLVEFTAGKTDGKRMGQKGC